MTRKKIVFTPDFDLDDPFPGGDEKSREEATAYLLTDPVTGERTFHCPPNMLAEMQTARQQSSLATFDFELVELPYERREDEEDEET